MLRNVFTEMESLVGPVFKKYRGHISGGKRDHSDCHDIIDVWPMAKRSLLKIHESTVRRLKSTPLLSSPWYILFTRDILGENNISCVS